MNGAQALMRTLLACGVDTCFTNPGTSEMHFVSALDSEPSMRAVLALFEGVATGAADGFARMADRPAATLLHLGPGLGNGLANLHNARKARTPLVNIVGDHATYHTRYDAQLQSDIETVARNVSGWVRTSAATEALARDAAEAVAEAAGPPGQVATLILPADVSWSDGAQPATPRQGGPAPMSVDAVEAAAGVLRAGGDRCALLLGGRVLRERGLRAAARISVATGARLLCETFPARLQRGAGLPPVPRLAYLAELAGVQMRGLRHIVLVDAAAPVSFFAYPGQPSYLVPEGCQVHALGSPAEDVPAALEALAETLGGARDGVASGTAAARAQPPTGALTAEAVCQAVGATLPEGAIVSDESQTSGLGLPAATAGGPPHDLLALTGGAIGQGLPVAVGAAVACPDRPVLALEADGSAMYTLQSLWTMAREQLDVTVVILNNGSYAILEVELQRVGAREVDSRAREQLDLTRPRLDFVALGHGMGVPSRRVESTEELVGALREAYAEPGPHLIETVVPGVFSGWQLRAMPRALRALKRLPRPLADVATRRFRE